jgi:hypothetical protein
VHQIRDLLDYVTDELLSLHESNELVLSCDDQLLDKKAVLADSLFAPGIMGHGRGPTFFASSSSTPTEGRRPFVDKTFTLVWQLKPLLRQVFFDDDGNSRHDAEAAEVSGALTQLRKSTPGGKIDRSLVPAVLDSFAHQDSRVRTLALAALRRLTSPTSRGGDISNVAVDGILERLDFAEMNHDPVTKKAEDEQDEKREGAPAVPASPHYARRFAEPAVRANLLRALAIRAGRGHKRAITLLSTIVSSLQLDDESDADVGPAAVFALGETIELPRFLLPDESSNPLARIARMLNATKNLSLQNAVVDVLIMSMARKQTFVGEALGNCLQRATDSDLQKKLLLAKTVMLAGSSSAIVRALRDLHVKGESTSDVAMVLRKAEEDDHNQAYKRREARLAQAE